MANNRDAQIIHNEKDSLKVRHRTGDKTTTLQIVWRGKHLEIHISIETEYPKRTVYTSSVFRCGSDIADMIAKACARETILVATASDQLEFPTMGNAPGNAPGNTSITEKHYAKNHDRC